MDEFHERRLTRSSSDRIVSGVAAGMAEYFGLDATLVRLAWIVLMVMSGGAGVVVYVLAWYVIPDQYGHRSTLALLVAIFVFGLPFLCFLCMLPFGILNMGAPY